MGLFDDFMKRGREGAGRTKGDDGAKSAKSSTAPVRPQAQAPRPQAPIQPHQPAGSGSRTYTVQAGDTLSEIAARFYGDPKSYARIFEANRDLLKDPDLIQPGQMLKIP